MGRLKRRRGGGWGKGRREEEGEKVAEKGNIGESSRLGGERREAVWSDSNNMTGGTQDTDSRLLGIRTSDCGSFFRLG